MSLHRSWGVGVFLACLGGLGLAGCGSDDESPQPAVDSGAIDSTADTLRDSSNDSASDSPGESAVDAPIESSVEDTADASPCGATAVGQPCGATQPCVGSFICYGVAGSTGFCAPPTPQCGGFAMVLCPAGKPCLRPKGSSLGYCPEPEEKSCICKPDSGVDGC